jgi:hypothetical protein
LVESWYTYFFNIIYGLISFFIFNMYIAAIV